MDGSSELVSPDDVVEINGPFRAEAVGGRVKIVPVPARVRVTKPNSRRGLDRRERIGLQSGEPQD